MFKRFGIVAASLMSATIARAEPPGGISNSQYAPYFRSLQVPGHKGNYCCNEADCRSVESRFRNGQWEIFASRDEKEFGTNGTDRWEPVPPSAYNAQQTILPRPAEATACFVDGKVRCFDPPVYGS